jgi:hypothetical protein
MILDDFHNSCSELCADTAILNKLKKLRPDVWDKDSSEESDLEDVEDDQEESDGKREE